MKELWKQIFQYVLAAVIAGGLILVLVLLINNTIPVENKDVLLVVVGVLASAFTAVVSYFFGSSKGSAEKNEMIKNGKP